MAAPAFTWRSPQLALVLGALACAWQISSFYVRERLAVTTAAGVPADTVDLLLQAVPLSGTGGGIALSLAFASAGLVVLVAGMRRGQRQDPVQHVAGVLCVLALAPTVLAPASFGG